MVIQGINDYIDNGNGVIEFSLVFYVAPVIFIYDRGSPLIQTSSRPAPGDQSVLLRHILSPS